MSGSQPKSQVYLKFELIRVLVGCQNSHKTIKQEPYTDSPKKKKKKKKKGKNKSHTQLKQKAQEE